MRTINRYQCEVCDKHFPSQLLAEECEALCAARIRRSKECPGHEWGYTLHDETGKLTRLCTHCGHSEKKYIYLTSTEQAEKLWGIL